jgi:hypothetical protein
MSRTALLSLSFILLLLVYPLTALGTDGISPVLWWLGIAALLIGGLIPPVLHFVGNGKKGKGEESEEGPRKTGSKEDPEQRQRLAARSSTLTGLTPTGAPPGRELPRRVKQQIEVSGSKGESGKKKSRAERKTKKK